MSGNPPPKHKSICPAESPKPQPPPPKKPATAPPVIEFPHFLRIIGPKHIKILMQFVPSAITYGAASLVLLTYMTDWKAVLQYLPYYNGKFVEEIQTKREEPEEETT